MYKKHGAILPDSATSIFSFNFKQFLTLWLWVYLYSPPSEGDGSDSLLVPGIPDTDVSLVIFTKSVILCVDVLQDGDDLAFKNLQ